MQSKGLIGLRTLGMALVATGLVGLLAAGARADQVTSKGTVLKGKVTSVSSTGITFDSDYGKGTLAINWTDIEDIKTDVPIQILYGDGQEVDGPLQGFTNGSLFVGPQIEGATMVDVKTITMGVPIGAEGLSWQDRMRSYWRYWHGNFDLGLNYQAATTNSTGLLIGFNTTRRNDPLRLIFGARYRYATQTTRETNATTGQREDVSSVTQDSLYGIARAEYDLTDRLYGYGSGEATYDGIQKISIRAVPKAGLGYTFWEQKLDADTRNFLSGEVGPSYVYERFFGGDEKNYFAISFGLLAGYYLPYGAHFDGLVTYLPSVSDFTHEYLLHSEASLTMPVYEFISAKLLVVDEYSSPAAPDAQSNSLFITFGLSVVWGS